MTISRVSVCACVFGELIYFHSQKKRQSRHSTGRRRPQPQLGRKYEAPSRRIAAASYRRSERRHFLQRHRKGDFHHVQRIVHFRSNHQQISRIPDPCPDHVYFRWILPEFDRNGFDVSGLKLSGGRELGLAPPSCPKTRRGRPEVISSDTGAAGAL